MTTIMPFRSALWLCALAAPAIAFAQADPPKPVTVGPPIQKIATASAVSTEQIGSINGVRELPDGRVLVNDGTRRRLLLMDTTLHTVRIVLDSLSEIANTYGVRTGALLPYRGDSILFIDPASYAMVVLDKDANIARVRSVWRVQDVSWVTNTSGTWGWPGLDAQGRMVYRVPARPAPPLKPPPAGVPYFPPDPDSAFIVAVNLETRTTDTLGAIRIPKSDMRIRMTADRGFNFDQVINPLPATDEWAVLPDGRVAFVRWRDYRIEYLNPDGKLTSSQKLPYDWQHMSDDDKQHMVDSVKTVQERQAHMQYVTQMIRWVNQFGKGYPANFTVPEGYTLTPGVPKDWTLPAGVKFPERYIYACPPGVDPPTMTQMPAPIVVMGDRGDMKMKVEGAIPPPPPPDAMKASGTPAPNAGMPACLPAPVTMTGGNTPPPPTIRPVFVMRPDELPDYRPPLPSGGAVRADADGNLWIRTIQPKPVPGGPVYDIVSPDGELVSRLQTPPGYTIVGFGKGKIVYLSMRDPQGIHLARVRLK